MKRRELKPEQKALIVREGLKGRPFGEFCAEHARVRERGQPRPQPAEKGLD